MIVKGQVYKIHSDFYYVKKDADFLECKLRDVIKKKKINPCVGDFVEVENNFIVNILPRNNFIERPQIANLDLLAVVCAIKEPQLDFIQLNRYLIFAKIKKIPAIICFNKEDLSEDEHLKFSIKEIYESLGYDIFFTSAKIGTGLETFKNYIKGKTVAFAGQSGVGKSSLINALGDKNTLKTGALSLKNAKGVHTTRHIEIFDFENFRILDTPGFSNLKFDFIMPQELGLYFEEFRAYREKCKYKNCLHTENSKDCEIVKNIDKINPSRYQSYLEFLKECFEYKEKVKKSGLKKESFQKENSGKNFVKIGAKKRQSARNVQKQRIKNED